MSQAGTVSHVRQLWSLSRHFPSSGKRSWWLTSSPSPGFQSLKHKSIPLITVWTVSKWDIFAWSNIKRISCPFPHLVTHWTEKERNWYVCFGVGVSWLLFFHISSSDLFRLAILYLVGFLFVCFLAGSSIPLVKLEHFKENNFTSLHTRNKQIFFS